MGFNCRQCTECCNRYYITLLPKEAKRIAKSLNLSEKEFIKKHTQIYLQLFPATYTKNKLVLFNEFIPKKLCRRLGVAIGYLPDYFLVLPSLAFKRKRKGKACVFLKEKKCAIHSVKPRQCSLFPFISFEKKPLQELYPFCVGLSESKKKIILKKEQEKHFRELGSYFNSVKKNGFLKQWSVLPEKGVLVVKSKLVSKISKKDLLQFLEPML